MTQVSLVQPDFAQGEMTEIGSTEIQHLQISTNAQKNETGLAQEPDECGSPLVVAGFVDSTIMY